MKSRTYPLTLHQEKFFLNEIIDAKKYEDSCGNKGVDETICSSCNSCSKRILNMERTQLESHYDSYDIENPNSEIIEPQKEAFISMYTNTTAPLKRLKQIIKNLYTVKCPFCGIIHWTSYDHYLPKKEIPEYSAFGKNLIPSCTKCNSKKGTVTVNKDGDRILLNPYFDEISETYLLVDINFSTAKVIFKYDDNAPSNFKRHFKRLDLLNRYSEEANSKISEFIREVKEFKDIVPRDVKLRSLNDNLQTAQEKYGPNDWEVVIRKELINKFDEL